MDRTSCSVCHKTYSRSDALKRHFRIAHGDFLQASKRSDAFSQQPVHSGSSEACPPPPPPPPHYGSSEACPPPHFGSSEACPPPPPPPPPHFGSSEACPPPPPHFGSSEAYPPTQLHSGCSVAYPPSKPGVVERHSLIPLFRQQRCAEYSDTKDADDRFVFKHPFTAVVAGPTMSGKSTWVKQLLVNAATMISPPPARILWLYKRWQPLYTEVQRVVPGIEFIEGIPSNMKENTFLDSRFPTLVIIDDLMKSATSDEDICDLYTEGAHHRNLSIVSIFQNNFYKAKGMRTMNLNCQYLVLFKNPRDIQQFSILARQMYGPNWKKVLDVYKEAVSQPYGHLLIDLKQNTPESKRLVQNIFKGQLPVSNGYKKESQTFIPQSCFNHHTVNMERNLDYYQQPSRGNYYEPMDSTRYPRPREMLTPRQETPDHIKALPSCSECGIIFSTLYDLQKHVRKGCPMDEDLDSDRGSDLEDKSDSDMEFDDSGFNRLINKVYDETDEQYQQKVQSIINSEDLTQKEARNEAKHRMLPKTRTVFLRDYKDFVQTEMELQHSELHREVIHDVKSLMDKNGLELSKAISRVVNGQKRKFDELLEPEESDDESDTAETDESDTDE